MWNNIVVLGIRKLPLHIDTTFFPLLKIIARVTTCCTFQSDIKRRKLFNLPAKGYTSGLIVSPGENICGGKYVF